MTAQLVSKSHPEIIGEAPAMQEVFRAIGRLSNSNISVLINGESGTGKELVAHALHKHSPRKDMQFVPLNVAAIPKELIESELFGHEKRVLNYLVNEYLLQYGYKLTAITFSDENASILQTKYGLCWQT